MLRMAASCLMVMLCVSVARSGYDEVQAIIKAHDAGVRAIETLTCQFIQKNMAAPQGRGTILGQYCRTSQFTRIKFQMEDGKAQEELITSAERVSLGLTPSKSGGRPDAVATVIPIDKPTNPFDVWQNLLLSFPGPQGRCFSLAELAKNHQVSQTVKKVKQDGVDLLQIELSMVDPDYQQSSLTVFLDPSVNYLARKTIRTTETRAGFTFRVSVEVESFQEARPGVFVPVAARASASIPGRGEASGTFELSSVVVNAPVSQDLAHLIMPDGTRVIDKVRGVTFDADQHGQARGAVQKLPPNVTPLSGSEGAVIDAPIANETYHYWLGAGFVAMLITGLLVWRWRKRA